MDYLSGDVCWDEQGTFVFEALQDATVQSHPHRGNQFKTNIHFFKGELVAIDLVRPSPNGPLLRLSDGCGWLFQQQDQENAMTRVSTLYFLVLFVESFIYSLSSFSYCNFPFHLIFFLFRFVLC